MKQRHLAAAAALIGFSLSPAVADTMMTPVLKTMLDGMDGTEANIIAYDLEPGFKTDHHSHPGHVFVYVLEGTIVIELDGQDPAEYSAGDAFYEVPNLAMVGSNKSATERAKFIVFQLGEAGQPLTVSQ